MAARHFTVEEANTLLPKLRGILREIQQKRRELADRQHKMEAIRRHATANGGKQPREEFLQLKQEAEFIVDELKGEIRKTDEMGILIKDLDAGLVDFPTIRDGQEVLLCWKLDEPEVGYWHGMEEGFRGRKPIR